MTALDVARDLAIALTKRSAPDESTPGRRTAVVSAVNADHTLNLIWATGDAVNSVPYLAGPYVAGDVVILLGVEGDYIVLGAVGDSHGGRGIVTRVWTNTDASVFAGPPEFEVLEMRTPTVQFFDDRLYRSTFSLSLAANGGNDVGSIRLQRSGPVTKFYEPNIDTIADGFGNTTVNRTADYGMPTGSYYMRITFDPNVRSHKFRANLNAFHTVEDIGPRDPWGAN